MSHRVVIVGAGFGGIAAAIELRRHGFDEITLLERAEGIGGTWLRALQAAWTECNSWYRVQSGRIVANWPGCMREYERALRVFVAA